MTCSNPLFEKWLTEWSKFHQGKNSSVWIKYEHALKSLQLYPTSIKTGADCKQLKNFDPSICQEIDMRMKTEGIYPEDGPDVVSVDFVACNLSPVAPSIRMNVSSTIATSTQIIPKKQPNFWKVSAKVSADDAILLALYQKEHCANYRGFMTKTELKQDAQIYCAKSFTKSTSLLSLSTAWKSIHTLTTDGYVMSKNTGTLEYFLTDAGRDKAKSILEKTKVAQPALKFSGEVCFKPGEFEIVLLVNSSQIKGRNDPRKTLMTLKFDEFGIPHEFRRLSVGKFVWVVREKLSNVIRTDATFSPYVNSLTLPYVVERIQMECLDAIISDGRYKDQKKKLKATKLQGIYVIEYGEGENTNPGEGNKKMDIVKDLESHKFMTKETTSFGNTLVYLAVKTKEFVEYYKNKTLVGFWKFQKDVFSADVDGNEAHLMFFSDFVDYGTRNVGGNDGGQDNCKNDDDDVVDVDDFVDDDDVVDVDDFVDDDNDDFK